MKKITIFMVALLMVSANSVQADLVGLWHFDGNADDSSGNGNDGTVYGASYVAGKCAQALEFDGVDDYVDVGEGGGTLDGMTQITISVWVYPTGLPGGADVLMILGKQDSGDLSYAVMIDCPTQTIWADISTPTARTLLETVETVSLDKWTHIVMRWAGNDTDLEVFKNGVECSVAGFPYGIGSNPLNGNNVRDSAANLWIGRYQYHPANRFQGIIDEVRIYNHALTPGEIEASAGCGVIEVEIDIKPGSYPNSINPNAGGVIPVAILTTTDFDASTVNPETVELEGTGARGKGKSGKFGSMEDVDGDGDLDLVVQIENVIEWALEATDATLTGETYDGIAIHGTDSVNIVPLEE